MAPSAARVARRRRAEVQVLRSVLERAAITACQSINRGACACEKSPTVCPEMLGAAGAVLRVAAPDVLAELNKAHEHAAETRALPSY